jgi:hypothetical protein
VRRSPYRSVTILTGIASAHAVELDAKLIPHGRRYRDLTLDEMCSFTYGVVVEGMDAKRRAVFDAELTPDDVLAEEFDWLPEGLRGERPPAGWIAAGRT